MILTYDTETTGLPSRSLDAHLPTQPRIVQLGAILDDAAGNEIMRLNVIIAHDFDKLPEKVQDGWIGGPKGGAAAVHGITPEMSKALGVNERGALELFLDMVDVAEVIVGHNIAGFDEFIVNGCVRRSLDDVMLSPFRDKRIADTMQMGKPVAKLPARQGGFKNPSLIELHKHLFDGEGFDGAHAAINDVIASRRCFYRMQEMAAAAKGAAA